MLTAAPWGIEGRPVTVTATFSQRLPAFQMLLDEVVEFSRPVLEGVREAQRAGVIRFARSQGIALVPAKFALVATLTTGQDSDARDINRIWGSLGWEQQSRSPVLVDL